MSTEDYGRRGVVPPDLDDPTTAAVGISMVHLGGEHVGYPIRLSRGEDGRLLLELWEPLAPGAWAWHPVRLPKLARSQVTAPGHAGDPLAEIDTSEAAFDLMALAATPVHVAASRMGRAEPGGPYNDGGVAEYFVEAGGRTFQVVPGHGVVVLVPSPAGAQVYEAEHAIALGDRIATAGRLAAAHAHTFTQE